MFFPEGQIRVHLYGRPVDMRKSYDGLYALTRQELKQDPLSGELFAFINRRATQIKVLYFDRNGLCVWSKRLELGCFISDWRTVRTCAMDWTSLKLLLEGIVPAQQRKRFRYDDRLISTSHAAQSIEFNHAVRHCDTPAECR